MILEREREALMRLTMCARGECPMCKYEEQCDNWDFRMELATKNMNILADALRKTKPTSSKMEQVDKDINVRGKWETPPKFEHKGDITTCVSVPACLLEIEDEPQTERYCTNCKHNGVIADYECRECCGMDHHEFIEPQTERSE